MRPPPNELSRLRRRVRWWTACFILGLVLSGATAIPLATELNWLVRRLPAPGDAGIAGIAAWVNQVQQALTESNAKHPFLAYGTDWLAFGHFVIALAFVGALRDPVRNRWLFTFGLIACGLVVPYAFILGAIRGIPIGWRLIDCSFGVGGAIPLWLCRRWTAEMERQTGNLPAGLDETTHHPLKPHREIGLQRGPQ